MKRAMFKEMIREIKNTHRRFISILLIILLGAGFFAGIKAICPDMKIAGDNYFDKSDFMDFKIMSTLGITDEDVEAIKSQEGIESVMPAYSFDVLIEENEKEFAIKLMTLPFLDESSAYINKLEIVNGRLPENVNECVTEESFLKQSNLKIGDKLVIHENNSDDVKEALKITEYTIVGTVNSPMYMSVSRGTTTLGNGRINAFAYIPDLAVDLDYYTEVFATMKSAKELRSFEDEYEVLREREYEILVDLASVREKIRYSEILDEANTKIEEGESELNDAKKEADDKINEATEKLNDARNEIANSEADLIEGENIANAEFKEAEEKLESAWNELNVKESEYNNSKLQAETIISNIESSINEGNKALSNLNSMINTSNNTIILKKTEIEEKNVKINEYRALLENASDIEVIEIENNINLLENDISLLEEQILIENAKLAELNKNLTELNENLNNANFQLNTVKTDLEAAKVSIESARKKLEESENELRINKEDTYKKIEDGKAELEKAKIELEKNEEKLEEEKLKAQEQIDEAQRKLDEAKEKLEDIKEPEWYILDRDKIESYVSYFQDADRVGAIAQVFPIIFFVVAALVSLTSMTRMVEEQRSQIGTLKALGYSKLQIASKYILYAGTASILGSIIGITIGFDLLPRIIFNVYAIMYNMPDLVTEFNFTYAIIAILVSVFCTCFATFLACVQELKQVPANLMRPKAPKAGKRILLEKINFIWKRMNFSKKVTARNIFRYKKRFFMTIIGIGGCTALLVAGFGLKDSVTSMVPLQYESVFNYNFQVTYKDKATLDEKDEFEKSLTKFEGLEKFAKVAYTSMKFGANDIFKDGTLVVVEDIDTIDEYINFRDRKTKEKYYLNDDGVIITEKLATMLDINVGDTIDIKDSDNNVVYVKVLHITENYIQHYVYITPNLYRNLYNNEPKYNNLLVIAEGENEENIKEILENNIISSANYTSGMSKSYVDAMSSLNSVVLVLIISAGALAFIVLYNLSNINISERIRELATIKVLGFYDGEVSQYVYRENIILTILGIIIGLGMGYFLNIYIITTCEVDIVMFSRKLAWYSYVLASIITVIFTIIVNVVTHFSLKKIDMIESLKSVE